MDGIARVKYESFHQMFQLTTNEQSIDSHVYAAAVVVVVGADEDEAVVGAAVMSKRFEVCSLHSSDNE